MTKSEYQELVEFLALRFDRIDERFSAIDRRFDGVDKRFDAMDERFGAMDKRFDAMDERFGAMDKRFDAMDERFDGVDKRFDAMDERFGTMDERFNAADERSEGFEERLRRVEILGEDTLHQVRIVAESVATVDRKLDDFRSEVADSFREHRDLIQTSYRDLDLRLTSMERQVDRRDAD